MFPELFTVNEYGQDSRIRVIKARPTPHISAIRVRFTPALSRIESSSLYFVRLPFRGVISGSKRHRQLYVGQCLELLKGKVHSLRRMAAPCNCA